MNWVVYRDHTGALDAVHVEHWERWAVGVPHRQEREVCRVEHKEVAEQMCKLANDQQRMEKKQ